ncbi:MAG: efflux RND transporter periplasmic adaptor subunit [Pirellulales bacterium]
MIQHVRSTALLVALAIVALAATGCGHKAPSKSNDGESKGAIVQVVTGKPERKTISLSTTQPGQIEAFEQTPLFAKVAGYVEEVFVDIGDSVKKDQVLIKLSVPEMLDDLEQKEALVAQAAAEVKQAESTVQATEAATSTAQARITEVEAGIARADAEHERWKSEHARIKELAAKGSVTKKLAEETLSQLHSAEASTQEAAAKVKSARATFYEAQANVGKSKADLVAAEARLRVAKSDLARANTMLGYLEIKAPYDGTVTRRLVDKGHYVSGAGGGDKNPSMVVARTDVVRIFVEVPELEAAHVDAGDPARVKVQALEVKEFDAQVIRTSWTLLEANHSLRAAIDVPNPQGLLRPGMYAAVTIRLDERKNAMTLPATAIVRDAGAAYCWSVDSGKIERRSIELGLRSGGDIEIVSGLDSNQVVVVKPAEALRPGQQVRIAPPAK